MEVTHETTAASELRYGQTLVGVTAVPLASVDGVTPLTRNLHRGVLVRCPGSTAETNAGAAVNTHPVWVGADKNVTKDNGTAIPPGNAIEIPIDDLSGLWIISTAPNQRVSWMTL